MNNAVNTVAIVDYGMGNLRSVSQALQAAAQGSSCSKEDDAAAAAAGTENASGLIAATAGPVSVTGQNDLKNQAPRSPMAQ